MISLQELEDELKAEKQARIRSELQTKAIIMATQKGLPVEMGAYFVGQNEDTAAANLAALDNIGKQPSWKAVEEKFKECSRNPAHNYNDTQINPWKKETFNLTEQGRILRDNQELAKQFQSQANSNG